MTGASAEDRSSTSAGAPRAVVWLVVLAVVGSAAAYLPGALHPAMLVKHVTVVLAAGALLALAGVDLCRGGRPWLPGSAFGVALALFAAAVVVAATAADVPALAWTGEEGRYSGALGYLAAVVVAAAVVAGRVPGTVVLGALLVGGGTVVATALVDLAVGGRGDLTGQLANPDFLAAYTGLLMPLALTGAAWPWAWWARVGCAGLTVSIPVVLRGAGTVQGPLAAAAGLAVLGALWWRARRGRGGRLVGAAPLAVAALAAGVALSGAAGWGPAGALTDVPTFESRTHLWRTALSIAAEEPVTGVGLDRFGSYYHAYRPIDEALRRDLTQAADAAHSVPLQLLATGGAPTALSWLALPVVAAVVVARRWKRADPTGRRLAAAFLAADAAYLVQSLVSLDVPPLLTAHLVLMAGAVVAVGTRITRARSAGRTTRAAGGLAATAGVAAIVVGWTALAADLTAGRGARLAEDGRHDAAVAHLRTAVALAPWRAVTAVELARVEADAGRAERALSAVDLARARDPRELEALVSGARLARALGRSGEAVRRYADARSVAPRAPDLALEHAAATLAVGRVDDALTIVDDVLRTDPENPDARRMRDDLEHGGGP